MYYENKALLSENVDGFSEVLCAVFEDGNCGYINTKKGMGYSARI